MPKKKGKTVKKSIKKSNKLNVIFDIDDTLIHTYLNREDQRLRSNGIAENTEYSLFNAKDGTSRVYFIRNYTHFLLNYCLEKFNVGIWSVGRDGYIIPLLKDLLTEQQYKKLNIIISSKKRSDKYTEYIDDKNKKTFKIDILNMKPVKPLQYLFDDKSYSRIFNPKNTILIDDSAFNISVNPLNSIYVPMYCIKKKENYLFNVYQWLDKH